MNAKEVKELRARLGMNKSTFARLLGADVRTVTRWETGYAESSGTAEAVMVGIRESLAKNQHNADVLIKVITSAVDVGGLAYLIVKLVDLVTQTKESRHE